MAEKEEDRSLRALPENDTYYRWLTLPPIYCDHYTAQGMGNKIIRISFGESFGKNFEPIYRTSIAMPLADIRQLHRTLGKIIKEYEVESNDTASSSSA